MIDKLTVGESRRQAISHRKPGCPAASDDQIIAVSQLRDLTLDIEITGPERHISKGERKKNLGNHVSNPDFHYKSEKR